MLDSPLFLWYDNRVANPIYPMISAKAVSYTEGYRSGHNEAVLKTVCLIGTWVRIPHPPPTKKELLSTKSSFLFIQAAGLAYHHRAKCGVYHQQRQSRCCISSRASVYFPVAWWYTTLRVDDIQCFALMIYTPSAWLYRELRWSPCKSRVFVFFRGKKYSPFIIAPFPDLMDLNLRLYENMLK